jgi:formate/nitrite transporter FocA (FNT family)
MADRERHPHAPSDPTSVVDSRTPPETLHLAEQAGIAKAKLSWPDLIIKSFIAGIFISLGAGFDLVLTGGAPGLRSSNPALATLIGAFSFPTGFVCIMLTNMELCTSNMFVMAYSTLQRRTTVYDLARNWIVSYVFNIAGCLFYAGVLFWWSDTLNTDAQTSYAVSQAEMRVNVNWGYNVTRGIMCNWLVGLAFFLATQARDNTSKIYGTSFGVGEFIWASCIPVTIGNIIGGAGFGAFVMWMVYGRHEASGLEEKKRSSDSSTV